MATSIQVTFDCADPGRQAEFWAEALHYGCRTRPAIRDLGGLGPRRGSRRHWNDAAAIEDPDGVGPRLYFQRVPEGKVAKNRMHLDLNVGGGRDVPLEERKVRRPRRGRAAQGARAPTITAARSRRTASSGSA